MKYSMHQVQDENAPPASHRGRLAKARLWVLAVALAAAPALKAEGARPANDQQKQPLPFIIGGEPVETGTYPWLVAVRFSGPASNFQAQFCAGTVIAPNWVLTAGHCILVNPNSTVFLEPSDLQVLVDSTDLIEDTGQRIDIERIIVHEGFQFTNDTVENDIALLKLAAPVNIEPVTLNALAENEAADTELITAGWGATDTSPLEFPSRMQQVVVPVVDDQACFDAYQMAEPPATILDQHICAGLLGEGGKDSCTGDSGGPLFLLDDESQPTQIGITSFGVNCAEPDFPGVYTRVSSFLDWIEQNMVSTLYFSQIGKGASLLSADVVIFNQSADLSASGEVLFWDPSGAPIDPALFLDPVITPSGTGGPAPNAFNLAPLGAAVFSAGSVGDLLIGSATVVSDNQVSGVVRFSLNGGIAGVRSSEPGSSLVTPVRFKDGIRTGIAVRNTESTAVTTFFSVRNESGELLATEERELEVNGRLAVFADELFPEHVVEGFLGTLTIDCPECRVAAIALELGANRGEFTALPVSRIE